MQLRADVDLPYPREVVFTTYRDRLADLLPHLPNIRAIKVRSREEQGDDVLLVNDWTGGGDIPAMARSVLRESMLTWTDYGTYKKASWVCTWRTEIHAFPAAVKSAGEHRFVAKGDHARIEFRGDFTVDATKIPGVPRLLAGTVGKTVEGIFVEKIQENLVAVGKGLGALLREKSV